MFFLIIVEELHVAHLEYRDAGGVSARVTFQYNLETFDLDVRTATVKIKNTWNSK